ncbi:MAG TPA: alginate lyase family protein [Terracidiphilus sp.]|nr:alginate lyase family protein [Terracidiphilus sp.]
MPRRDPSFVVLCCGIALAAPAWGQHLLSPWDWTRVAATGAPYNCPAPPAFARTLNLEGSYIDKKYSIIDPQKQAVFEKASEGPTHLGQFAGLAADAWLFKGSRAAAACVYSLLTAAAKADAWDDKMPTNNSIYMQNWLLSGTAIAYLKVRNSGAGTAGQDALIQKWFGLLAARVREYFDSGRKRPGSDAWNNHMYWAGLSVAAEGVATGDAEAFLWGLATYEMGIHAINPDGSLDAEMGRGQRALHYQLYALGPLVMVAELAASNGIDLYSERDGVIHKLVEFDVAAMKDPSLIAKRTGVKQDTTSPYSGLEIGWAMPWVQRFPNADLSGFIAQAPTLRFWQWGGAPPDAVLHPSATGAVDRPVYDADLKQKVEFMLASEFPQALAQSYFLGEWCADDLPNLHGAIADGGDYLTLNNGQGSTSTGELHGPFFLVAPAWNSVSGALTPDRSQIDWSNGTYWTRCPTAPIHQPIDLTGKWMAQVGSCSIQQQGAQLKIGDTRDCQGSGSVDDKGHLALEFSGVKFEGSVTADGNHINWQDGSYWTRAQVYSLDK